MVPPTIRISQFQLPLLLCSIAFLFCTFSPANGQSSIDSLIGRIDPQKWAASIGNRVSNLEDKIISKSQKTLAKLQRQEEKICRRMIRGRDSLQGKATLADIKNKYQALQDKLKNPSSKVATHYIPKLDTLTSVLKFLDQNRVAGNVKEALGKTQSLQDRFQQAEEIRAFIKERRRLLKSQLERLGLTKQLKKFNKEFYYYNQQVQEYKSLLKDSKKAERKALELLSSTKLFKDFMRKNSLLASLFRLPGGPDDPSTQAGLAGLQSRAQINALIQRQIASGGPNAQAQFRQNLNNAQAQLNQLKNKVSQFGSGSSDDIMPEGFKPNSQKTKNFLKRIEIGTNIQTQKTTNYFPVTSDIGLSLGYKLNDKSIIGVGASYKIGMGRGWNHIRITREGMGFRSFIDWKIKGNLWMNGGFEINHKSQLNRVLLTSLPSGGGGREGAAWQQSGLLGLSKTLSVKSKLFKKTKLQLLWDFLSYQQVPKTQAIIFRIGYNFK